MDKETRKVSIDQLIDFVLKAAKEKREAAGFNGEWTDGGASALEEQVKFYKLGMQDVQPKEWEKFIPPLTDQEKKMRKHPLQFEYCECGCKCYSGTSKGIGYSIFWNLKESNGFFLWRGHGHLGTKIGTAYNSYEDAVLAAQKDYDSIP